MGEYYSKMVAEENALPGRKQALKWTSNSDAKHYANKNRLFPPFPENTELAMFGMGCFWGAEKRFWQTDGVYSTQVGYSAGYTENPTYEEVCTGKSGHSEVVRVVFYPSKVTYEQLVKLFFESHNPTQGMRQGNDTGSQYRSGIYYFNDAQKKTAFALKDVYQVNLAANNFGNITTEIQEAETFYYAEEYHQQYLAKNVSGYCGMGGTGISCPVGVTK